MTFPDTVPRTGTNTGGPTNTNARTRQTVLNVAEEVTGCECKANLANNNRTIANKGAARSFYDLVPGNRCHFVPGRHLYRAGADHLCESAPGRSLSRLDPLHSGRGRRTPG